MANSEAVYGGGLDYFNPSSYSSIQSPYSSFADLASSQDARTANQVKETSKNLNTGLKTFEVAAHSPEVFEAMPQEQLQEINRLAKLVGAEPTMHAPMVDPTGIVQDKWDEESRKSAERQLWSAVERSHDLNPEGNVNVTFHATTAGLPGGEQWVKEDGKEKLKSFLFVGPQGKINQIKDEPTFFPTAEDAKDFAALSRLPDDEKKDWTKKRLEIENKEIWTKQLGDLNFYADRGEDAVKVGSVIDELSPSGTMEEYRKNWESLQKAENKLPGFKKTYPSPKEIERSKLHGANYLKDAYRNLQSLYDLAYERGTNEDREKLDKYIGEQINPHLKEFENIGDHPEKLAQFAEAIEEGVKVLGNVKPQIFKPLREFAIDKSSETISGIAFKSYNQFGETSPILSIENHPAGQSILTTGSDIRDVVEKAREKLRDKLISEKHLSYSEANRQSKKLIGATWDVGHINMLRKYGYEKEDLIRETEKVAPVVNKVHLSDNFGFEHTELPMGMGNVPIAEIMGKLDKEGFKGKKIAEALSWWQHFSENGHAITPTMQAMGSPIYGMQNAPYWNQVSGNQGAYFSGMGSVNPQTHHSIYGSGFTTLPRDLGGDISGDNSRFSGTPNA